MTKIEAKQMILLLRKFFLNEFELQDKKAQFELDCVFIDLLKVLGS